MRKTLIVIDMQNDFIDGSLGTYEAKLIVPKVRKKIDEYIERGDRVIYTRDTHFANYLDTNEGKHLPVRHCIMHTPGWWIHRDVLRKDADCDIVDKNTFGYIRWDEFYRFDDDVELVGLCTDICVVSNALILKAMFPEIEITVDASCCAGTTYHNHNAAIQTMKSCQINIIGE